MTALVANAQSGKYDVVVFTTDCDDLTVRKIIGNVDLRGESYLVYTTDDRLVGRIPTGSRPSQIVREAETILNPEDDVARERRVV